MTGVLRKATLLATVGVLAASAAMAGVPSAANSDVPVGISLVGRSGLVPDPFGNFTVTVRDLANNLLVGASVVVDLSFATDVAICNDQLDANATVNCLAKTTRKFTDGLGQVSFIVVGGSNGAGNAVTLAGGARIYANGVLLGSPTAATYDQDSAGGMGANDLGSFLTDFASGQNFGRSDYDFSGVLGANDLAAFLTRFAAGQSLASCVQSCF